jgi:phage terminase large subunit-like protein
LEGAVVLGDDDDLGAEALDFDCGCPGCRAGLDPFSAEHFEVWAAGLTLDSGRPWRLEDFQVELAADLFSGPQEFWVIIPEGNAKTTLFGGFALYGAEHSPRPWIPIGAASREQAEIMFVQAGGFVKRSRRLNRKVFRVYEGYRKISALLQGGKGIQVMAADANTGDGVIPFPFAFVDEVHRQADLRLYRLWKGKLGKRGATIGAISTAGEPGSPFEEMRETIRNNAVEREYLGPCHVRVRSRRLVYHEWALQDRKKARDLEVVKLANPLEQITLEGLEEKLASDTLDFGEDWMRLTCNIPTRSSEVAIPEADWDAAGDAEPIPEGTTVAVGADFAWLLDTTAIVPFWMKSLTERVFGEPEILTPPGDGTMLDPQDVKDAFESVHRRTPIEVVVMDVTKAEDIAGWLRGELGVSVVDRPQTNSYQAEDYERWMEALGNRWLRHTGHRDFRRHVLNAVAMRLPGGKHRFDRPSSSRRDPRRQERRVIDALTAAAMVHGEMAAPQSEPAKVSWRAL